MLVLFTYLKCCSCCPLFDLVVLFFIQMPDWNSLRGMRELLTNKTQVFHLHQKLRCRNRYFYCMCVYGPFTVIMLWLTQQQISSSYLWHLSMSHINRLIKIPHNLE